MSLDLDALEHDNPMAWTEEACHALLALAREAQALREDAERLDWLETQVVQVRNPLRYGSLLRFYATPGEEGEPSNLRAAIDAARKGEIKWLTFNCPT